MSGQEEAMGPPRGSGNGSGGAGLPQLMPFQLSMYPPRAPLPPPNQLDSSQPPPPPPQQQQQRRQERQQPQQPPAQNQEKPKKDMRFTKEEEEALGTLMVEIKPIGPHMWEEVTNRFNDMFPTRQRLTENLRRKFNTFVKKKIPTGDPHMPKAVRLYHVNASPSAEWASTMRFLPAFLGLYVALRGILVLPSLFPVHGVLLSKYGWNRSKSFLKAAQSKPVTVIIA